MPIIGVRQLHQQTAEVLRKVREEKAGYIITYQGRPVAMLLPLTEQQVEEAILQTGRQLDASRWELYVQLAEELRRAWPQSKDTHAILDEIREQTPSIQQWLSREEPSW